MEIRLLITTEELMEALGCGRRRAVSFGERAGAKVRIGHALKWNVEKRRKLIEEESE